MTFWVFVVFALCLLVLAALDIILAWRWFRLLRKIEEKIDNLQGSDFREYGR